MLAKICAVFVLAICFGVVRGGFEEIGKLNKSYS